MRRFSAFLLLCLFSLSTLVATPKPAEMTTPEIINELKLNSQGFVTISTELWEDSVLWRKRHEQLSLNFESTEMKLTSSLVTIGNLETEVSNLDSSLTEAEDFSKSLNEDNQKLKQTNTNLWIAVAVLVTATVTASLVAIFK